MTLYVTVINYDVKPYYSEAVYDFFDSIHKDKESAERRCDEIKNGINLPEGMDIAWKVYNNHLKDKYAFLMLFYAEVIPYQIDLD